MKIRNPFAKLMRSKHQVHKDKRLSDKMLREDRQELAALHNKSMRYITAHKPGVKYRLDDDNDGATPV